MCPTRSTLPPENGWRERERHKLVGPKLNPCSMDGQDVDEGGAHRQEKKRPMPFRQERE
jgi:hypothetical protein